VTPKLDTVFNTFRYRNNVFTASSYRKTFEWSVLRKAVFPPKIRENPFQRKGLVWPAWSLLHAVAACRDGGYPETHYSTVHV
jgi:hypothetical protein